MPNPSYEIRLPAVRDSLRVFYEFFQKVSAEYQLPPQTHFDIELSIEEALTNVISHAYRNYDTPGDFMVRIAYDGDYLSIHIQDWGEPFDPQAIKPFDYSAPVEMRINGGMGVHFMRSMMDSITYQFDAVDGTILTMTKKLDHLSDSGDQRQFDEQTEHELQVFNAVAVALSTERHVDALLDLIVDKLIEVVNADRGTLYLVDADRRELVSKILQDDTGRLREIRLQIGEGIAGYVAETGETVNIVSAEDNPHFAQNFDRESGYQTESMICTPMRNAQGDIIGVVQLLNKRDGVFTRRDEILLTVLASQAAIAIENAQLIESEKEKRHIADTLREVSSIINSALDLERVLELILQEVERVLPFDTASILLIEDDYLVVRAARGFDEAFREQVEINYPLFRVDENPLIQEMIETPVPIIIPDVEADPRWITIAATSSTRSWMGAPLIVGGNVIGELSLDHSVANFYRQDNSDIAHTFANQAAAAIERARLHLQTIQQARLQQEADTARTIQTSFLPDSAPEIDGWDIAVSWRPAKEVAGDFYDFINLPDDRIGFVVADVCGKGIPASLFMALSRTVFRVMAKEGPTPSNLLTRVNDQIKMDSRSNLFVTLFYGVLDTRTGEVTYSNGGHNPPILMRKRTPDEPAMVAADGPALGAFPGVTYTEGRIALAPGDVLAVYTDGITEAINSQEEEFAEDRLLEYLQNHQDADAASINMGIHEAVRKFTGDRPADDDATLLIIKRLADE
ncbi:MAG: SpoIIE family protein phosphatase [Chloroflexi bacterium]|nr:SpoIIE family protein phosphatase [Chloroflexota bacterium]